MGVKPTRSSRVDLVVNYSSTAVQALIPLAAIPILARNLNPDVMALVLLFTTFAILLAVLDGGLSATSMRQVSNHRGGGTSAEVALNRIRSIEFTYGLIALALLAVLIAFSDLLASQWFTPTVSSADTLTWYLRIVFVGLAARFVGGLYRNTLLGLDLVLWVGWFGVGFTLVRYGLACAVAVVIPDSGTLVLIVIALSYVGETAGLALKSRVELHHLAPTVKPKVSFVHLREVMPFALSILSAAAMWAAISQTDRVVLSGQLSLAAYGEYAILIAIAASISLLGAPVAAVVQPRLTRYLAAGDELNAMTIFSRSAMLVSALVFGATIWLVLMGSEVILVYLGQPSMIPEASLILGLYSVGNAAVALSAFSYYLQYALGNLRLHLTVGLVQTLVTVPLTIFAAVTWGPLGCAAVWAVSNGLVLMIWVPYVLHTLRPTWVWPWLKGTLTPLVSAAVVGGIAFVLCSRVGGSGGGWQIARIVVVGAASMLGAVVPVWMIVRRPAITNPQVEPPV